MSFNKFLIFLPLFACCSAIAPSAEPGEVSRVFRDVIVEQGQAASEIRAYFCSVVVRGKVGGDVITFGGDLTVGGSIDGDAIALGGGIHLFPEGRVAGDVTAIGGPVRVEKGARLQGDTDNLWFVHIPGQRRLYPGAALTFISVNLALLLFATLVFRRCRVENLSSVILRHPWTVAAAGTLFSVVFIVLFGLTGMLKRFELLVLLIIMVVVFFTCLAGYTGISATIGRFAGRRGWLASAMIGAVLLNALLLVPVIGFVLLTAAFIISAGSPIASGFGKNPDWLTGRLHWKPFESESKPLNP